MKKRKKLLLLLCCTVLLICAAGTTKAMTKKPTIHYDGSAKMFTFLNMKGTDLFTEFKEVMPGDVIRQKIVIEGEHIETPTQIYLYAAPVYLGNIGKYLTLRLISEKGTVQAADILARRYLEDRGFWMASFEEDESIELEVELEVSEALGNIAKDASLEMKWLLCAYEMDEDGLEWLMADGEIPKTGDENHLSFWMLLAAFGIVGMVILHCRWKKK